MDDHITLLLQNYIIEPDTKPAKNTVRIRIPVGYSNGPILIDCPMVCNSSCDSNTKCVVYFDQQMHAQRMVQNDKKTLKLWNSLYSLSVSKNN